MAISERELGYGAVAIFDSKSSDLLGRGSYGKVCKAKCGQLPCAAKLPHDIILDSQDPNIRKFVEQFEQECHFLKMIKHPNVVQFLGTYRDPRSQRLALLMELMDESLTRFLERSTGPLPYHTQLNICQDVALALAYLHSNDIIHRDLTSNNVLLIGEGSRAKVTDFGMSRLLNKNPRMTQLTECPGNFNYMPPETLISPPRYTSKLDCFSHGVLTIQIATRQFPNPGDATTTVEDARSPTGIILIPIAETDRRKKDIDLVVPDHPLLPLALHCLKDRDTERPSANVLCQRLAMLKCEPRYTHSVEQSREQNMSLQTLQQQIRDKKMEVYRAKIELYENQQQLERIRQEKDSELERVRFNHKRELHELQKQLELKIQEKNSELDRSRSNYERELRQYHATFQQQLQEREDELERAREQYEKELNAKETMLDQVITDSQATLQEQRMKIEQLHMQNQQRHEQDEVLSTEKKSQSDNTSYKAWPTDPVRLTWRQGTPALENMLSFRGAAVANGNTAYFSQDYNVYSYSLPEDKWTTLPPCKYRDFSLAVIKDTLTAIGGWKCAGRWFGEKTVTTNVLKSCVLEIKWKQVLPPMPTARNSMAAVTTPNLLVVAGGESAKNDALSTVEVLDLNTLQWSSASSSPKALEYPHMTLCGGYLYLSEKFNSTMLSCSVEDILKSCKRHSTNSSDGDSVWTSVADIPLPGRAGLATLSGHVMAIGGRKYGGYPTGALHCYDRSTNSWILIGEMPTPRSRTLVAVLPSNKLIVVGGDDGKRYCNRTETLSTGY